MDTVDSNRYYVKNTIYSILLPRQSAAEFSPQNVLILALNGPKLFLMVWPGPARGTYSGPQTIQLDLGDRFAAGTGCKREMEGGKRRRKRKG